MSNKRFGYARVSTTDQNEDRQVLELLDPRLQEFQNLSVLILIRGGHASVTKAFVTHMLTPWSGTFP